MNVAKDYFLVEIDKEAQNQKRGKVGSIEIPENYQDMAYNLQYGTVVEIGPKAAKQFPEVCVGDILIFHHHVEYKPRTEGDHNYNDHHLIETLENNNELRIVNISREVFGVMKLETQEIIPFKNMVFCHEHFKQADFQLTAGGIYISDAWEESMEAMNEKLEDLKQQAINLQSSSQFKDVANNKDAVNQLHNSIMAINKEREELSRKINQEKYMELTLLFINPETCKEWGYDMQPGDKIFAHSFALYPLDIDGVRFTLVVKDYIALIKTKDMKSFTPLHDRVVVIPEEIEKTTKGGIIIPGTVQNKPNKGVVKYIGPGKANEPTTLKAGDKVLFGKGAGTDINFDDDKKYLLMREGDIYGSYK